MRSPTYTAHIVIHIRDGMSNNSDDHTIELRFVRLSTLQDLEQAMAQAIKAAGALPR